MWYQTPLSLLNGLLASILLTSGLSCSKHLPTNSAPIQGQTQTGDDKPQQEEEPIKQKSLYITGIEFPKGHNWKPELGAGSVEAKMFLMKDGERIVEIPTGADHLTSIDSDLHQCFDGKLYTFFHTGYETIVKCNGKEIVRFQDRNPVYDFFAENGKVHTLSKKGKGFTYRVNSNIVFECKDGSTYPGIYKDGKMTVFTYKEATENGNDYNYGYIGDGSSYNLDVNRFREIEALMMHNKTLYYLGFDQQKSMRWYVFGNQMIKIGDINTGAIVNTQLVLDDKDNVFVLGDCYFDHGTYPAIWNKNGLVAKEGNGSKIAAARADDGQIYYAVVPKDRNDKTCIKRGSYMIYDLPNYYDIIYSTNIGANNKTLCIAMHNVKDNKPAIWKDGITTEYDFNGFFTGVSYQ